MAERFAFHIIGAILRTPVGWLVKKIGNLFYPDEIDNWLGVHHINLTLPNLSPCFDGYRLVQISDFHIGTWLSKSHLLEAMELVNEQQPDMVAITGDFVTYKPQRYVPILKAALQKLKPKDGTVAILGNHDHWSDPTVVRQVLDMSGVTDLSNTFQTIHRDGARLHIAGVDDIMEGLDRLDHVISVLPEDGCAVLLAHEPDYADVSAASGRFDLQLSGHTHGGQIMLPRLGAPYLPRMGRKYPAGLYQVGGMLLYTNRGLGTAEFQVRYNCQAEISVFHLHSPGKASPHSNG